MASKTSTRKSASLLGSVVVLGVATLFSPLRCQDESDVPPPAQIVPPAETATPAPATTDSVSFQDFYDSLANQGTWIQSGDYGYVWQPQVTDPNWAPYTNGHWVYTDDGWTWASDESFGWATYHYGRWVNIDGTGWCWVPGYTWAPAWVSWRYGNGYAGWAPLPPDSFIGIDYSTDGYDIEAGYHIGGDCDGFYGIGAAWYVFLPVNCLGYRHYHGCFCPRGQNFAIINRTSNLTNLNVSRGRFANGGVGAERRVSVGGPGLATVNAVSSTPVARVNLVRTNQPGMANLSGNSLSVFAPQVITRLSAQPARVSGSIGAASVNRGTDVMHPLTINSRMAGSPATEQQIQQARIAQAHTPATAKVATDFSSTRPMQVPLSTLRPTAPSIAASQVYNTRPATVIPGQRSTFAPSSHIYPQPGGSTASRPFYSNTGTPYPSPSTSTPQYAPFSRPTKGNGYSGGYGGAPAPAPSLNRGSAPGFMTAPTGGRGH